MWNLVGIWLIYTFIRLPRVIVSKLKYSQLLLYQLCVLFRDFFQAGVWSKNMSGNPLGSAQVAFGKIDFFKMCLAGGIPPGWRLLLLENWDVVAPLAHRTIVPSPSFLISRELSIKSLIGCSVYWWSSLDAIIPCTVILPVSLFYFKVDKKPSIIIITLVYTILLTLPNNIVSTFTTQHTLSTNLNK